MPSANDEARARSQDLSVSAARLGDHAAQPGVGDGHHLHSDGPRLVYLAVVLDWLAPDSGMAAVDHDGGELLRRGARRRLGSSR